MMPSANSAPQLPDLGSSITLAGFVYLVEKNRLPVSAYEELAQA
jgi:hypothetical protein